MARIKSTFLSLAFSCDVDSIHKFFTAAQVQYQRACVFCFPAWPLAQTMAKKASDTPPNRQQIWPVRASERSNEPGGGSGGCEKIVKTAEHKF
jgi:hypothetical protein